MTALILGDMPLDHWCQLVERALRGDAQAIEAVTDLDEADIDMLVDIAAKRRKVLSHAVSVDHLAAPDPARRAGPNATELRRTIDEASDARGQARLERALSARHATKVAGR